MGPYCRRWVCHMNLVSLILRHAPTQMNMDRIWQGGEIDSPLCAEGVAASKLTAPELHPIFNEERVKFQASSMLRAVQTAEILAEGIQRGSQITTSALLSEARIGELSGLEESEIKRRFPTHYAEWRIGSLLSYPGGESAEAIISRVAMALPSVFNNRATVTVTHEAILRAIRRIVGLPPLASQSHLSGIICRVSGETSGLSSVWQNFGLPCASNRPQPGR
ncbi:histidine phosphatase family protein [Saccharothrix sp. NRRL B-16348]|uniref:histidine phosphatase family protein n=1 Tax=Saccharothrix sp. NRRL B-16348 TaxID=1415542 RepID=UPI0009E7C1FB